MSFACLLGQFYGFWEMSFFGTCILLPSILLLVYVSFKHRHYERSINSPYVWIVYGTIAGILAALCYDLYRLPFVLYGIPLFKVFPQFGELLLADTEPRWLVYALGWLYHFSNAASLGIMFLVVVSCFRRVPLVWGGLLWALMIEGALLMTPYADAFGLKLDGQFIFLTLSAHLIFGVALGYCLRRKLPIQSEVLA